MPFLSLVRTQGICKFYSDTVGTSMDYLESLLDTLKSWLKKLLELLGGAEPTPELEPIPIPVRDRQ